MKFEAYEQPRVDETVRLRLWNNPDGTVSVETVNRNGKHLYWIATFRIDGTLSLHESIDECFQTENGSIKIN